MTRQSDQADSRYEMVAREFASRFGGEPAGWVRAPGRAELLGTDTDDHLGYVITMAVHLDTWIAYRPSGTARSRVFSVNTGEAIAFDVVAEYANPAPTFERYVQGVAAALAIRGYHVPGVDAVVHTTVPVGGGLSSSAALEVATALMFMHAGGFEVPPGQIALATQEAENNSAGVGCGILDQYSSVFGREGTALCLDCRALSHVEVTVPADVRIVVCDTNVKRTLAGSDYAKRREECDEATRILRQRDRGIRTLRDVSPSRFEILKSDLPEVLERRARFIVEENQRAVDFMAALVRDDRDQMRRICEASYDGMGRLYEKTISAMDHMHQAMTASPGCIAARQMGGGFGGCLVGYVEQDQVEAFAESVLEAYRARSGTEADVHPTRPSAGAGVLLQGE